MRRGRAFPTLLVYHRRAMAIYSRLLVLVFAAILSLAQQEAATHAVTHVANALGSSPRLGDDVAHHECPDCIRLGSLAVGGPPGQHVLALIASEEILPGSREPLTLSFVLSGPPRIRGPPYL